MYNATTLTTKLRFGSHAASGISSGDTTDFDIDLLK
jgi:hypothetical protein